MKELKKTTLKSAIFDLGFIACYITAQIYHYFEYYRNDRFENICFLFIISFTIFYLKLVWCLKKIKLNEIKKLILCINLNFILFLSFLGINIVSEWPYGANHSNYNFFLILMLISLYIINLICNKNLNLNLIRNRFFLLYTLIAVYLCAALHKMNFDFVNPEKSCANWYHIKLLNRFFPEVTVNELPKFIKYFSPLVTIFIELLAPFFLLFRRTKSLGVYLALFLHSYLSLGGFSDFSSLAFSILVLYIFNSKTSISSWFDKILVFFFTSYIVILLSLVSAYIFPESKEKIQTIQGIILLFSIINILTARQNQKRTVGLKYNFKFSDLVPLVFIVLITLFGLLAYTGYRTGGTFTMFSNLKIAGEENNHFFLEKYNLFDHENEIYQIVDSESEKIFSEARRPLDWITKSGIYLVHQKSLKDRRKFSLKIRSQNGELINLNHQNINNFLRKDYNFFFKKTYMYSLIPDKSDKISCRW